jgi:hypothetical protein
MLAVRAVYACLGRVGDGHAGAARIAVGLVGEACVQHEEPTTWLGECGHTATPD